MNRIFITVNGVEHELNPDDFNEVLKILRKNKNYDCFINIEDNYIGLIWPDSNAVCSYMCVFMDWKTPLYTSGVSFVFLFSNTLLCSVYKHYHFLHVDKHKNNFVFHMKFIQLIIEKAIEKTTQLFCIIFCVVVAMHEYYWHLVFIINYSKLVRMVMNVYVITTVI